MPRAETSHVFLFHPLLFSCAFPSTLIAGGAGGSGLCLMSIKINFASIYVRDQMIVNHCCASLKYSTPVPALGLCNSDLGGSSKYLSKVELVGQT